jgi:hypothetical protein
MRQILIALALLASAPAAAQVVNPPAVPSLDEIATKAEVQAAKAAADAAAAAIPVPADAAPPAEMIGGSPGSTNTFRRGDAAQPRITRAATVSTASDGTWTVTWTAPLAAVPAVLPIAVNPSATQAIVCNATSRTTSGASGKCWQAMSPAIISITVATNPLPAVGAGVSVQVFAIPPTQ